MDLQYLIQEALIFLQDYGFLLIFLLAFIHPLFEGPLALFTLTLGIQVMGLYEALVSIFIFNMIGSFVLYILLKHIDQVSHYYLHKKKVSKKVLLWLQETKKWKHIVVLGVPFIPTYPVKIGYLFSEQKTKYALLTMALAYVFLTSANLLILYGVIQVFESGLSRFLGFLGLLLFVSLVYFGQYLIKPLKDRQAKKL